jgi:hypothetical protein
MLLTLEENEERTCLDEIGGGAKKKLQAMVTQSDLEEELEPNLDQVIDNVQVEYVEPVVPIVQPTQLVVTTTKSIQPVQHVVELVQIDYPQFSRSQPILFFGHFIKNLR